MSSTTTDINLHRLGHGISDSFMSDDSIPSVIPDIYNYYMGVKKFLDKIENVEVESKLQKKIRIIETLNEKFLEGSLTNKFIHQLIEFDQYLSKEERNSLSNTFYANIDWIVDLEFNGDFNIHVTESPSLFFQLKKGDYYKLNLEIFVETNNSVYSLYHNDELVLQDFANANETFEKLSKELDQDDKVGTMIVPTYDELHITI